MQAILTDARTLNPILADDPVSADVVGLIFNAVMRIDPATAEPRGDLAKSWEVSPDGLTHIFTLHDAIKWQDGSPLTSADVKFTYDLHLNVNSGSTHSSELAIAIAAIDTPDDRTATFTLNIPSAPFLVSNMIHRIVPMHILHEVEPKSLAEHPFSNGASGVTIGSGPFAPREWVKNDRITLARSENYWRGEPNLDQVTFKVVPDVTAIVEQLVSGEVDYSGRQVLEATNFAELSQSPLLNVVTYDTFNFSYYGYQLDETKSALFQDRAVRQALLYALDRRSMVDSARSGLGRVAIGTMPATSWANEPDAIELKYSFDPDTANQLLDQAGWLKGDDGIRSKDGARLSFALHLNSGNDAHSQYATIMQQAWRDIGVECTPVSEEWNAFLQRLTVTRDFEMFLIAFSWGFDPDQSNLWSTGAYARGFNLNRYSNPEVDQLLDRGLKELSLPARKELYLQLQNVLMQDLPSAIIDFPRAVAALNRRVHNVVPNAVDDRWNAHEWWVESR